MQILSFIQFYIPGFKSGGPVRSLSNIVKLQNNDFKFSIYTSDRDFSDSAKYPGIKCEDWNFSPLQRIYYSSASISSVIFFLIKEHNIHYDILYLNSFFSFRFSIIPIIYFYLFKPKTKILIAPRGEFSEGALRLKYIKKKIFIFLSKNFYEKLNISWHSTSKLESQELLKVIKKDSVNSVIPSLYTVPNLTDLTFKRYDSSLTLKTALRITFISRVNAKKNLLFALELLSNIDLNIEFTIIGPIDDLNYWNECKRTIRKLPNNISVVTKKPIPHAQIIKEFSKYDLFLFPTLGENFGHVILESLFAGTSVIVGEKVPWPNCENRTLTKLELDIKVWKKFLHRWYDAYKRNFMEFRNNANKYATNNLSSKEDMLLTKNMFNSVFSQKIRH